MSDIRPISNSNTDQPLIGTALFAADSAQAKEFAAMLERLGIENVRVLPGGGKAALDWCQNQRAEVLMVDLDGETAPLKTIAELTPHCEPTCQIIALGSRADINLYRALLHSGVMDYLQKPVQLDLLANALDRAHNGTHADFARTGRSIAVTACAGGLGTSSVAAGLAQLLSTERHIPVAMVDFDRHKGDQGVLLGVSGDAGLAAALANSEIDLHLLQRAMIDVNPRLKLLAQEPAWQDQEVVADHLLALGATLCQLFNQVIWDLPAGWPTGVLDVLRHAEVRILLTELTVQGARSTQRLLAEIGDESDGQQLLLVHNPSHGTRNSIPQAQFEDYVGHRIALTLPHVGGALGDSLLHGPMRLERTPLLRQGLLDLADLASGRKPQSRLSAQTGLLTRLKQVIGRRAA
ncbi:AAA family ATPase [Insolitispirillum peregrinum]|uniref:Pilus assembly protein CpaE n=1 Tax=Insolitispirillum peregrinum TaxID=80876 RepID=A0A1N7QCH6_9PROT|nr:response regulator [Insolitispirillum peregrinum]SIT20573.1 pilus assembly protein CpaE [Insolitispirillum peregrinum]